MNDTRRLNRRHFLKTTSALTASAPFLLPSHLWAAEGGGPNAKIVMGFIGVGKQGSGLLGGFLGRDQVQVVAVCDVDTTRREHSRKTVNDHYAKKNQAGYQGCEAYTDFRALLARKDIDAVCIAVPDHWHALPVMLACKRGKDIYCEKPLSLTIAEAIAMVKAVRRYNRVFQTGSMQRSSAEFLKACELVRNGCLGPIKQVIVDVGGPSRWCDLPEEPMEPGLDWDYWLGPAPKRPYNSILSPRGVHDFFPNWRNYREYSGGGMTDWGAHHFDIAQWGLGMDHSGPIEIIPPADPKATKGVRFLYANGVEMIHGDSGGILFIGEKGKILVNRGKFQATPEEIGDIDRSKLPIQLYHSTDHLGDFLKCVRTRQRPICDVEIGARSVTVCHLGNLAYWYHRRLRWDPKKQRFLGDAEANQWLDRPKRAPYGKYAA